MKMPQKFHATKIYKVYKIYIALTIEHENDLIFTFKVS